MAENNEINDFPEIPDSLPEDFSGGQFAEGVAPTPPGENPYSKAEEEYREKEKAYAKFREACMDEENGCFGNYCNIMKDFKRDIYVKRCAKCRESAQCFAVSQMRLMAEFYKQNRRGDDWRGEGD